MADQTPDGADRSERSSLDLDALAVSDRFRLFNFTRRDDHVTYLWVLRALDRLRGVHQVQAHPDEVAAALAELAAGHDEVPRLDGGLREKLDALAEDGVVHRLEDASRAGSLARYRNRQSVYQFSELGYRAFAAVEDVLSARIRDANLSRLVFSDILDDLRALAAATKAQDQDQVYRRLSRLDTVLDDMSRRAAQFHLTLGEVIRSTDTSPDTFLRYKNALLAHMTEFMAELDRYLPRLAAAVAEVEGVEGVEGVDSKRRGPRPGRGTRRPCCGSRPRPTSARSSAAMNCSMTGAAAGPHCAPGSPPMTRPSPGPRACAPPPAPPSRPSSRCSARSPRRSGAG